MRIEKKTWPQYFQLILEGKKTYDLRVADFVCQEGDILVLREWDPETKKYTGCQIEKEVTYVGKTKDFSFWNKEDVRKYGLQCMALKAENISKETFAKEIAICKEQFKKQGGCNWGKCEHCGVVPLLVKLYEGKLIESKEEIKKLKKDILRNNK